MLLMLLLEHLMLNFVNVMMTTMIFCLQFLKIYMKYISLYYFLFYVVLLSTLREYKAKLRKYLTKLEEAGLVSREDGYQTIITSIAQDIANKGKYRQIQAQVNLKYY